MIIIIKYNNMRGTKSPGNFPRRKLLLNSGDIYLPKSNKINRRDTNSKSHEKSDKFITFKEECSLPKFSQFFSQNKKQRHSIDFKQRLRTLDSRPDQYRIKSKPKSRTISTDNHFQKYVKRELCSIDLGDLKQSAVLNHLDHKYLTEYEKQEIKKFKHVFYLGHRAYQRKHGTKDKFNDAKGNYKPIIGDHIGYRFEIIKILGCGAFGKVLQVYDHKSNRTLALKILKDSDQLYQQFKLEIKILKIARQNSSGTKNIIQIKGDFQFRGHICIVTEILSLNLYNFLKGQNYEGLDTDIIRKILIQVLQALVFLHHRNIIHCDIKPENIVFRELGKSGIKLIDFGSSCFYDKKQFTYIQSRYYRAPEIVLVKPYDKKIDMWSLGCLVYELYTGTPLFPARNENQQMSMIASTLGNPPSEFLNKCERKDQFEFRNEFDIAFSLQKRVKTSDKHLLSFIQSLIKWSPEDRPDALEALKHPFIVEGLPKNVKHEHIKQMSSENPYNLF